MTNEYSMSTDTFFDELMRISSDFVWKNPALALANESQSEAINVEQYILARQGRLSFDIIEEFSEEVLMDLGMTADEATRCCDDHDRIPADLRDTCVERQTEWIINHYEEHNNYYRMLNGLPDVEDDQYLYNTSYPAISDSKTPLHELDTVQLYSLENNGYLDELLKKHPDKKYIKYLASRKIDIYTARNSDAFSILWATDSSYTTLLQDFLDTYNECRIMITNVFYQSIMSSNNTEYIGFIGLMILFQTIMLINQKLLDTDITRDFYDEDSLRIVYDSYGVPYYSSIPIEYHKKIIKNINLLIAGKGSTRVFYQLFEIFGLDDMVVFEFYMMKVHKFANGKPVFYKNEDGSYNYKEMYDIMFGKVQLYNDPTTEMQDSQNQYTYEELTRNDPYWVTDEDLINKLYSEDFNYMESKYLGIQTTFNMMKIMYESSYYLKLILDNRNLLKTSTVYNNATRSNVNIFDLIIYICALIMKKYGYEGNIPTDVHEVGKVLGFNFQTDLTVLKKNITANDYLKNDKELLTYLETMNVNSLSSVKTVYTKLTELRSYLVRKMTLTDDVPTYWAYYELYQSIMYSDYVQSTFKKSNGETASTFLDLLQDINSDLYMRYMKTEDDDLNDEISDSLFLLKNSCSSLTQIQYADGVNIDVTIEYLFKLLEFFKSTKADLTGYDIVYSLLSSAENSMKLMTAIDHITDDHRTDPIYTIFDELTDVLAYMSVKDKLTSEYKTLRDYIKSINKKVWVDSVLDILDMELKAASEIVYQLVTSDEFLEELEASEIFLLNEQHQDGITFSDSIIPIYEDIKEILQYYIEDNHELFDLISGTVMEHIQSNHKDADTITLTVKLMLSQYINLRSSSYTTTDKLLDFQEIFLYDENHLFLEEIFRIFKEHARETDTVSLEAFVSVLNNQGLIGESEYTTLLEQMDYQSIGLLYTHVSQNTILYLEEVLTTVLSTKAGSDTMTLADVLKAGILSYPTETILSYTDYISDSNHVDKRYLTPSKNAFEDTLILLSQEISED